jgi:phage shock protein A
MQGAPLGEDVSSGTGDSGDHALQYKKTIESVLLLTDQIEKETVAIINETDATKKAIHHLQTLQSETIQQTGEISKELEELKLRNGALMDLCVQREQELSKLQATQEQQTSQFSTKLKQSIDSIESLENELSELKFQSNRVIQELKHR